MNGGNMDDPPVIGTGAFLLESFEAGQRVVVKRNPDYFLRDRPYIDGVESLRVTADPSLMLSSFRSGASNFLGSGVTLQMAEDVRRAVPAAVIIYLPVDRSPTEVILNANLDLFKDVRVRQAIHKAIDRKAISDTGWLGRAGYGAGLSLPDASYGLPAAELNRLMDRDLAGARQLMSQAGVSSLSFEITAPTYLAGTLVTAAELIQANLREIGITTTIKSVDTTAFVAAQQAGNFQMMAGVASIGAPNSWLYARYYTGGPQNWVKFASAELDRLIDQQAVLVRDPEGRKKILQDVQRKIIADAGAQGLRAADDRPEPQPALDDRLVRQVTLDGGR
jgi:ABC-type transport system substrate-binding protein